MLTYDPDTGLCYLAEECGTGFRTLDENAVTDFDGDCQCGTSMGDELIFVEEYVFSVTDDDFSDSCQIPCSDGQGFVIEDGS